MEDLTIAQPLCQAKTLVAPVATAVCWKIAARPYGSEGRRPRDRQECPYFQETGWETLCVSSSGGSMCGGFIGGVAGYVYCIWGLY